MRRDCVDHDESKDELFGGVVVQQVWMDRLDELLHPLVDVLFQLLKR